MVLSKLNEFDMIEQQSDICHSIKDYVVRSFGNSDSMLWKLIDKHLKAFSEQIIIKQFRS
jgi:hypothetical protein